MNNASKSYEKLLQVNTTDIPKLVDTCLKSKTNLLIYGEAGCGKSTIIQGLSDRYAITILGAAKRHSTAFPYTTPRLRLRHTLRRNG